MSNKDLTKTPKSTMDDLTEDTSSKPKPRIRIRINKSSREEDNVPESIEKDNDKALSKDKDQEERDDTWDDLVDDTPSKPKLRIRIKKSPQTKKKKRKREQDDVPDNTDEKDSDKALGKDNEQEETNPFTEVLARMKKKKRIKKGISVLEEEAQNFISKMVQAAKDDALAVRERRPAMNRLLMMPQVLDMLANREMRSLLVELDFLSVAKLWIQPLPNGTLGTITVRSQILSAISRFADTITTSDLKKSKFGLTVMALYKHKSETPINKRKLKALIEKWSCPAYGKSQDLRDLQSVQASRPRARTNKVARVPRKQRPVATNTSIQPDLDEMIRNGSKKEKNDTSARIKVPFSGGFQFTMQPQIKTGSVTDDKRMAQINCTGA